MPRHPQASPAAPSLLAGTVCGRAGQDPLWAPGLTLSPQLGLSSSGVTSARPGERDDGTSIVVTCMTDYFVICQIKEFSFFNELEVALKTLLQGPGLLPCKPFPLVRLPGSLGGVYFLFPRSFNAAVEGTVSSKWGGV